MGILFSLYCILFCVLFIVIATIAIFALIEWVGGRGDEIPNLWKIVGPGSLYMMIFINSVYMSDRIGPAETTELKVEKKVMDNGNYRQVVQGRNGEYVLGVENGIYPDDSTVSEKYYSSGFYGLLWHTEKTLYVKTKK